MNISNIYLQKFKDTVICFYRKHKRDLPWRKTKNPYLILISEIMLQQTQVGRVLEKYPMFIDRFSNFTKLANASVKQVLSLWQGLGYNRRALYLKQIADIVVHRYKGKLPDNPLILDTFPGIGEATAASIAAFAYNKPTIFIETNIRRVFIHHFFKDERNIDDKKIYPLIQKTLDTNNPRKWYWALMDYGSYLGKTIKNPNKRSRHYIMQSPFEGSDRQIRGKILRLLLKKPHTQKQLLSLIKTDVDKATHILKSLIKEQFIYCRKGIYYVNDT